jgi:hypothetical protein
LLRIIWNECWFAGLFGQHRDQVQEDKHAVNTLILTTHYYCWFITCLSLGANVYSDCSKKVTCTRIFKMHSFLFFSPLWPWCSLLKSQSHRHHRMHSQITAPTALNISFLLVVV